MVVDKFDPNLVVVFEEVIFIGGVWCFQCFEEYSFSEESER